MHDVLIYNYDVTGYDKDGKPKNLKLSSQEKMQKGQYYIIHWEDRREIISSKEKASEKQIDQDIILIRPQSFYFS